MIKKPKNLTVLYSFIQFLFWANYATAGTFSVMYLLSVGISNTSIGTNLAISNILSVIALALLGPAIDRSIKIGPKAISMSISVILFAIGITLVINNGFYAVVPFLCFGLARMLNGINNSYLNSLAVASMSEGFDINFGIGRAFGSVGYAVVSLVLGFLVEKAGIQVIPYFMFISALLSVGLLLIFPDVRTSQHLSSVTALSTFEFFKRYKRYILLLSGLAAIHIAHTYVNNYALQVVQSKGGDESNMGLCVFLAAMSETVIMIFFNKILDKVKLSTIVAVSAISFSLKIILSLLVKSVSAYFFVQLLQMPAWGAMAIAIVYYSDRLVEKVDAIKGQSYSVIAMTVGSVLGSYSGGIIIDKYGINSMLLIGVLTSVLGTAIILLAVYPDLKKKIN